MNPNSLRSAAISFVCFSIGVVLIGSLGSKPTAVSAPVSVLLTPPAELKYFAFGYQENFSDTLWIRAIQDFDICEEAGVPVRKPKSSIEEMKPEPEPQGPKCNRGWVFRMLDAITEMTPKFRAPYVYGGIMLSVLVDDREGASLIFDKGLRNLEKDWSFTYKAAYHFMFEAKQPLKGAQLLVEAGKQGAPYWVFALAAKAMTKEGQVEFAERVLLEQIEQTEDEGHKRVLQDRLEEIRRGGLQTEEPAAAQ